jgi:CRISPR-associated protein Csx10
VKTFKRIVTRSAQSRKLRNSKQGQLFSIEAVEKPPNEGGAFTFAGTLRNVGETSLAELANWDGAILYVGGEKSTGYGRAVLRLQSGTAPEASTIGQRINAFNSRLRAKLSECQKQWKGLFNTSAWNVNRFYFTVDLLSETILTDELGFYAGLLPDMLSLSGAVSATRVRSYARVEPVSGWSFKQTIDNVPTYSPKRVQQAIGRGSVFVYRVDCTDDNVKDLSEVLCQYEQRGVGERRAEGYGNIRICDEFHHMCEVY